MTKSVTKKRSTRRGPVMSPVLRTRMINLIIHENLYDEVVLAKRLGVAQETIRSAILTLRDAWREEGKELFELYMARQLSEIEAMKSAIFDWAIGRRQIQQIDPVTKKKKLVTLPPNLHAIDSMLKLMEREARLMGLDRQPLPPQIPSSTTTIDLSQLSDEDLITLEVVHLKLQRSPRPETPAVGSTSVDESGDGSPDHLRGSLSDPTEPNDSGQGGLDTGRDAAPIDLTPVNGIYTNGQSG